MLNTEAILGNLSVCVLELANVTKPFLQTSANPPPQQYPPFLLSLYPQDYDTLLATLKHTPLPGLYYSKVIEPLCSGLERLGRERFSRIITIVGPAAERGFSNCPSLQQMWAAINAVLQYNLPEQLPTNPALPNLL